MENTNPVAFRSAFSGYNREDVNQYILQLNRSFEEREILLKQETGALEARIRDTSAQLEEAHRQMEEAFRSRESAERILSALRETNDQLRDQLAALQTRTEEAESQLLSAKERIGILEDERSAAQADDHTESEKSRKYDQLSTQIGDILINANEAAERIVSTAHADAARIVTETEDEAVSIRTRLSDTATEMLSSLSTELHASTESCITELLTSLGEMRENAAALMRDMEDKHRELEARIDYYQRGVSETIEKSLAEMDEKYGLSAKTKSAL